MQKFKAGDTIKRIAGGNNIQLGIMRGNLYIFKEYNSNGYDLSVIGTDGWWDVNNFELVINSDPLFDGSINYV